MWTFSFSRYTVMTLRQAAAFFFLCGSVYTSAESDAVKGKALFQEKGCAHCHTLTDAGAGGSIGPRLDGVGKRLKKEQIEHQITFGGNTMPPFGEALSPDEIHQITAYLSRAKKEIRP